MSVAQFLSWYQKLRGALLAIVSVGCLSSPTFADAPTLSYLYPAGAQRGTTTTIMCEGKFSWPVEVWASGVEVTTAEESGKIAVTIPEEINADRIWIRLYNSEGASAAIPFLIGSLPEAHEVEPNDAPRQAHVLAGIAPPDRGARVTVNGVLQKNGDVDGFAVELTKGQTLVAAVAANTQFGSPMDAILQVVSPDGTVLTENHDDVGLDPRLAFTATVSGRYIVRVFAFPAAPNQSIRFHGGKNYVYRLTLTTGPYITHTVPMSVPMTDLGNVQAFGWNLPPETFLETKSLSTSVQSASVEIEPSGVVRTSISKIGVAHGRGIAGSVRLRLVPHDVVHEVAQTNEQQPLTLHPPTAVTGCIDQPGTTDFFHLSLKKDQQLSVAVESLNLYSPLVPMVKLSDTDGKVAVEAGVSGAANDVSLNYKATQDGDYALTIRDRYGHGGGRYFYRLTVSQPKADFELTLATDAIVLTAEKPLEIPVTVTRHAGSGQPIEAISIEVLDLPSGTTSVAVVSEATGETATKVTLKLETDGTPYSGNIRIRGAAAESTTERFARTPSKFNACFDRLWLTVPGKEK